MTADPGQSRDHDRVCTAAGQHGPTTWRQLCRPLRSPLVHWSQGEHPDRTIAKHLHHLIQCIAAVYVLDASQAAASAHQTGQNHLALTTTGCACVSWTLQISVYRQHASLQASITMMTAAEACMLHRWLTRRLLCLPRPPRPVFMHATSSCQCALPRTPLCLVVAYCCIMLIGIAFRTALELCAT